MNGSSPGQVSLKRLVEFVFRPTHSIQGALKQSIWPLLKTKCAHFNNLEARFCDEISD